MSERELPTGAAGAAIIAAGTGLLALALSQVAAERWTAAQDTIHQLGKLWMPGAQGIGPYSGKETIALVVWLGTWFLCHLCWRHRDVKVGVVGAVTLVLIGVATTLLWPPVTELLVHHL